MRTYALAFAEVLFACVPDGEDIDHILEGEACVGCAGNDPGEVRVVRGLTLTARLAASDEVVWCAGPDGDLLDESGRAYPYAVRRERWPERG
ncbi:hypothetical protein [Methylobacterium isbiliense]|jgi:hypothetical protein|uniref:Uncharacterized protein n=1 Tax=Methylobacterium isbiliense TaxID=315478 RepID=A0ABQ4SMD7_9HYPH|nr:hypothetical protein [Methylobacterium isbiliense]MDN3624545.1 hypothetical protein [Methylobacterium isbiliense]GJE04312.1 hypothetical protein GMJLKIPL_6273 [Methylobacterium isbiliense]